MSLSYWISRKLNNAQAPVSKHRVHRVIHIAVGSIALSVLSMILSVFIVRGFQEEIQKKVVLLEGHIKIGKFDLYNNISEYPVSKNQDFIPILSANNHVLHLHAYAEKGAVIKTNQEVHGVLLKGISVDYDTMLLHNQMIDGGFWDISDTQETSGIIIGKSLAQLLKVKVGDKLKFYFMQDPVRVRILKVKGIFNAGMGVIENYWVLCPLKTIQKLNGWSNNQISGWEVYFSSFNDLDAENEAVYQELGYEFNTLKITDKYPEIFGWLRLLDTNVWVVLIFAVLVSIVNMIATLLIIILEKTSMIGLFRVFGANKKLILSVFFNLFFRFVWKGMLIGNFIALLFCFIQDRFHLLKLNEQTYYMSYVPIRFEWTALLYINLLTLSACIIAYIIPSLILSGIKPIEAIKFKERN